MPDGGQCDHGQHQRVRRLRGTSRHGAHVAQPLPGRPAVHPHNSYGGKSTCFGCVNCVIQGDKAREEAVHGGRTVWGVDLRPLACWDCGFESHREHECLLWKLCVVLRADLSSRGVLSGTTMIFCVCGFKSDIRGSVGIRVYISLMTPLKFNYFLNRKNDVLVKIIYERLNWWYVCFVWPLEYLI
jgi:hypothetical protein